MSDDMTAAAGLTSAGARSSTVQQKVADVRSAVATMTKFELNAMYPFGVDPKDISDMCSAEAHALCVMMGNAIEEVANHDPSDDLPFRAVHIGKAFHGIATLIALGAFASEGAGK